MKATYTIKEVKTSDSETIFFIERVERIAISQNRDVAELIVEAMKVNDAALQRVVGE